MWSWRAGRRIDYGTGAAPGKRKTEVERMWNDRRLLLALGVLFALNILLILAVQRLA